MLTLKEYEFDFETESFGALQIRCISAGMMSEIAKREHATRNQVPEAFTRHLLSLLASPKDRPNQAITEEDTKHIPAEEFERFAEELMRHNLWLIKDHQLDRETGTADDSKMPGPEPVDFPRKNGESASESLRRGFRVYFERQNARMNRFLKPLRTDVFGLPRLSGTTLSKLQEHMTRTAHLTGTLSAMNVSPNLRAGSIGMPFLAPAARDMTNRILCDVRSDMTVIAEVLAQTAATVAGLNDLALSLVSDYARSSKRMARVNYALLLAAAVSLLITSAATYLNYRGTAELARVIRNGLIGNDSAEVQSPRAHEPLESEVSDSQGDNEGIGQSGPSPETIVSDSSDLERQNDVVPD